jgi:hypothetical protein
MSASQIRRRSLSVELVFVVGLCSFLFSVISPIDDDIQQEAFSSHRGSLCLHVSDSAARNTVPAASQSALISAIRFATNLRLRYFDLPETKLGATQPALMRPHADRSPPRPSSSIL